VTSGCTAHERRAELAWDDPRLAVAGDPPLRARYRALQSWYGEHRLNARYAPNGPSGRKEPVGSLLSRGDVTRDRSLNFLCDPEILAFVEARSEVVSREGGAAERGRLFHNLLSSMPMAFSAAAVLRTAPDGPETIGQLFELSVASIDYVTAEWCPKDESRRIGKTAFDMAVRFRDHDGARRLLGVETKYVETPGRPAVKRKWIKFSDSCGWFRPGAADHLAHGDANQLWRNTLLAAQQEASRSCDFAHFAVVGLEADAGLWELVARVRSWLSDDHRDRLLALSWEEFVARLRTTDIASFAGQFAERYLDLSPLEDEALPMRLRRSTVAAESERRRRFADAPVPEPSRDSMGDQVEWGRWLPTVWRAVGDPSSPLTIACRPPARLPDVAAWWTPALHLMIYGLGWPSPALGLQRWECEGRPLKDPKLRVLEAIYGRHLEALQSYLWHGCGQFESVSASLGLAEVTRPDAPRESPRLVSPAVTAVPNPVEGGCDPLHLFDHTRGVIEAREGSPQVQLIEGDLGTAGPPRATLMLPSAFGWYRALHEAGSALPGGGARQGWRVDVVVTPIGHLGTFRQSRVSGRWFTGQHQWHQLGVPSGEAD